MQENIIPFILTSIAGLSTLLGTLFIFIKCDLNKLINLSLAFASGVMISVSLFDLIPESLNQLLTENTKNISFNYIILGIIIGIILSIIIDKLLPIKNKIYKVGIFSMIAIIIHNVPEGIITFLSANTNITLGITLMTAIALHNIPEGISISVPVYTSTKSKKRAVGDTLISALAEPLGALLAFLFLKPIITNTIMGFVLALTSGIMIYIGVFELMPLSLKYKNKKAIISLFTIGFILMIINHKILSFF